MSWVTADAARRTRVKGWQAWAFARPSARSDDRDDPSDRRSTSCDQRFPRLSARDYLRRTRQGVRLLRRCPCRRDPRQRSLSVVDGVDAPLCGTAMCPGAGYEAISPRSHRAIRRRGTAGSGSSPSGGCRPSALQRSDSLVSRSGRQPGDVTQPLRSPSMTLSAGQFTRQTNPLLG